MERRFKLRKRELLEEAQVNRAVFLGSLQRLERFVQPFAGLLARPEQQQYASDFIAGLISDVDRKNAEAIAYRDDQDRKPLQHFIGQANGDHQPLIGELARQVGQQLGAPGGVIVFDPSGFPKKGTESVGVKRQWCGRLGKVENCQVGVYMGYASAEEHALVNMRRYLPEEWAKDRQRRKKCQVPKNIRFKTRHDLSLEMLEEVGAFPHNMSNSSPVIYGDLIFVGTSNGQDESHVNIQSPLAPAIIALNKTTGELIWEDNSVDDRILHGQWASPTVGTIGGVDQVIMGQGDGWLRGYAAATGEKLWEFDTNPKDSEWPRTRNELIATAVVYDDLVYIANGQDPEHGEGVGNMYAIDATQRGDITETGRVWYYTGIRRSISTPAIYDGLIYQPDFSGFLHCLDAKTGEVYWVHDTFAAIWGSPLVVEGRVYLGDEDGDVVVLKTGTELEVIAEMNLGSAVYSTPVPANGVLFLGSRNRLFALAAN